MRDSKNKGSGVTDICVPNIPIKKILTFNRICFRLKLNFYSNIYPMYKGIYNIDVHFTE